MNFCVLPHATADAAAVNPTAQPFMDMKEKIKSGLKKTLLFLLNPRLLLCWGIAWLITNGWSYVLLALGAYFDIPWMTAIAGGYLTFLWLPISPEKIVTAVIAIFLLRLLFPRDEKTLAVLRSIHEKAKAVLKRRKKEKPSDGDPER